MSDFFDTPRSVVARKPHQCIACDGAIEVGEQHMVQTGFFDGQAFRNRLHYECWESLVIKTVLLNSCRAN